MKRIDVIDLAVIVTLVAVLFFMSDMKKQREEDREYIDQRFDKIEQMFEHRSELDSLYWNHLETCAFELREDIQYTYHN